jgi:lactoylglutathione lyase
MVQTKQQSSKIAAHTIAAGSYKKCKMKNKLLISSLTLLISLNIFSQENANQLTMDNTANQKTILGLRTVSYKVGDIAKAKEWYSKAFQTEPYFDEPFYVGFNIGGYELGLQPDENPPTEKAESVVAFWGVTDIEKEYNRFLELGSTENEKPTNVGGEIVIASIKDPWGNIIGLIYNPEFKPD